MAGPRLPGLRGPQARPVFQTGQTYQVRAPVATNTPAAKQQGFADVGVNLLMTTLAVVGTPQIPPGHQLSDSAPRTAQVQCHQQLNQLVLGFNPQPQILQLSASATQRGGDVQADTDSLPTREPIWQIPQGGQLSGSSPSGSRDVRADAQPTRLVLTAVVQPPFKPTETAALASSRGIPTADVYGNLLSTTLASAAPAQIPPGQQLGTSLYARYQIQLDEPQRPITLGIETDYSISDATTSYALTIENVGLVYAPGGIAPPPPTTEVPAGRNMRLTRYIFRVDGKEFETFDLSQALTILDQAKQLAKAHARELARAATDVSKAKVRPIALPKISGNRAIAKAVEATKVEIAAIYESALRDAEIAMWLEIKKRGDDEEDATFLLM